MVGHLLGSEFGPNSCGILLCPQYSYQKHQLFLEEHALLTLLTNQSCAVDTIFQLNFDIRSKVELYLELKYCLFMSSVFLDVKVSCIYLASFSRTNSLSGPARPKANGIHRSSLDARTATTGSNGNWIWKDSTLYRYRRNIHEAKQLAAKNMVVQEDMDPKALPAVDLGNLHGAQKYAQIGADAAKKLLQAAIESCKNYSTRAVFLQRSPPQIKPYIIHVSTVSLFGAISPTRMGSILAITLACWWWMPLLWLEASLKDFLRWQRRLTRRSGTCLCWVMRATMSGFRVTSMKSWPKSSKKTSSKFQHFKGTCRVKSKCHFCLGKRKPILKSQNVIYKYNIYSVCLFLYRFQKFNFCSWMYLFFVVDDLTWTAMY